MNMPTLSPLAQQLLTLVRTHLSVLSLSLTTRKLYLADLKRFFTWATQTLPSLTPSSLGQPTLYHQYLNYLQSHHISLAARRRSLAALKQLGEVLHLTYHYPNPITPSLTPQPPSNNYLNLYIKYLKSKQFSPHTIKSYKSDLHHFLTWLKSYYPSTPSNQLLTNKSLDKYLEKLSYSHTLSPTTIQRKLVSIRRFLTWHTPSPSFKISSDKQQNPLSRPLSFPPSPLSRQKNLSFHTKIIPASPLFWLNLGLIFLLLSGLGYFAFRALSGGQLRLTGAYSTTPVSPNRQLSFQGRLEDEDGTPIGDLTDFVFKLYDEAGTGTPPSGGSELYSSNTCTLDPDADGVFSTLIGDTVCGNAIGEDVFTKYNDVWLEVTVEGETLGPRQPIASVPYALNAETLQGIPLSATMSAVKSSVVSMNEWGEILVGEQSPRIKGISGTLAVSAPALSLTTTSGSSGNLTLAPDGTGQVNVQGNTVSTNFFNISNAQLDTGSLITGTIGNNNTGFKLLDLLAGTSPTSVFSVNAAGLTTVGADLYVNSGISLYSNAVSDDTVEATKFCTGDGETNCVTDFSSLTNFWTDGGTYLYPADGEVLGNSVSAGSNKLAGLYLADSAPLVLGSDNDITLAYDNSNSYLNVEGNLQLDNTLYLANGTTYYLNNSGTGNLNALTLASTLTLPNSNTLTGVNNYTRLSAGISVGGADTYYLNSSGTGYFNDITLAGGNLNTGNIALTIGDGSTDSVTFSLDDTGNSEVVLPNDSIGPNEVMVTGQTDEYCLTYEATGTTWEWQTCAGGSSPWTDGGTYLYPADGEVLGNSASAGSNKLAGLYLADSAPLTLGTDNDISFSFSGSELATTLGSNTWNIDSNTLFISGNTNRLGIGTASPLATLDIRSSLGTIPVASISGKSSMANLVVDQSGSGDIFTASSSGNPRFVIKENGNVGIGVSYPTSKLEIGGTSSNIANSAGDFTLDIVNDIILDADDGDIYLKDAGTTFATFTNNSTDLTLDIAGGDLTLGASDNLRLSGSAYFAGGTTYYVDGSGNAKFLDLQVADTGNPGLTVGNGSIGFIQIGGSTLSDNNGALTLDSDTSAVVISDDLTISGGNITSAITFDSTGTFTGTLTANNTFDANGTVTLGDGGDSVEISGSSLVLDIAGTDELTLSSSALSPSTTDSNALGTTTNMWSDLFLASGGVVNFDNGDITMTHSSNALTFSGGSLGIGTTPSYNLDVSGTANFAFTTAQGFRTTSSVTTGYLNAMTTEAITQTGAINSLLLLNLANITTNGSAVTGLALLDPDADTGGSSITAINIAGGNWDTDISFQNGETIDNDTNGVLNFEATLEFNMATTGDNTVGMCKSQADGTGSNVAFRECNGTPSDIAEFYAAEAGLLPGDITALVTKNNRPTLVKTTSPYQSNVLGIVSTYPVGQFGKPLGTDSISPDSFLVAIGLTGKVPARISLENGPITAGDPLVTATSPGTLMKALKPGKIVGYALEPYDGSIKVSSEVRKQEQYREDSIVKYNLDPQDPEESHIGKILVYISTGYYDPDIYLSDNGQIHLLGETPTTYAVQTPSGITSRIGAFANLTVAKLSSGIGDFRDLVSNTLTTSTVRTDDLVSPLITASHITTPTSLTLTSQTSNEPVLIVEGELVTDTLSARFAQLEKLEAKEIIAERITTKEILADSIIGLDAKLASLSTATTSSISDQELESITTRIKSRLANLTGEYPTALDIPVPDNSPSIASSAANLISNNLSSSTLASADIDFATINNYLAVLGHTTLTTLEVTSYLYTETITSQTNTLALQPHGGVIRLASDTLVVDSAGEVFVNGNLTVNGRLLADSGQLNTLELGTPKTATDSPTTTAFGRLLAIYNEQGEEVATIDASGSATLADLTTQLITIAAPAPTASASGLAEILGTTQSNSTAGEAILFSPNTELIIHSPFVTPDSLVYLTPTGNTDNQVLYIKTKHTCPDPTDSTCTPSFTVGIDSSASTDIPFNWWIIKLKTDKPN